MASSWNLSYTKSPHLAAVPGPQTWPGMWPSSRYPLFPATECWFISFGQPSLADLSTEPTVPGALLPWDWRLVGLHPQDSTAEEGEGKCPGEGVDLERGILQGKQEVHLTQRNSSGKRKRSHASTPKPGKWQRREELPSWCLWVWNELFLESLVPLS